MNKSLYFKLAKTNLIKNRKTYFPYILACIGAIIMFYTMDCIVLNEGLNKIRSAEILKRLLRFGVLVISLFSMQFIFYINSFLLKRRKKEIGLYSVLGMEKKHIIKVISLEISIIAIVSLVLGIIGGIIIGKLLFLILLNLLKLDIVISASFSISGIAMKETIELFSAIFIAIIVANFIQIKIANPIELLMGGQKGEKEPKTSWIIAILGIIELAIGYGIAVSIESPIEAIVKFFIAVILVIAGTYSTFIAGSIAFLKQLKRNKKFFYKTKNFVAVSGMIYRMKQNAAGLANICILSTAVLITISTTVSLYLGQEDSLKITYPLDAMISIQNATTENKHNLEVKIKEETINNNVILKNQVEYNNMELLLLQNENSFSTTDLDKSIMNDIKFTTVYTLEDYNKMKDKEVSLKDNEVLIFSVNKNLNYNSIFIDNKEYKVKAELNELKICNKNENNLINEYYIIVKDMNTLKDICKINETKDLEKLKYNTYFNIGGNKEDIINFCDSLKSSITNIEKNDFQSIYIDRENLYVSNGGFIFIGCFLGLLFTFGTILIIYYKQISEGYDDSERFKIMQKVGMSKYEVKATINKQILMVFFIPLVAAVIHIGFAFKGVSKLLSLFGLFNTNVFLVSIVITIVIFVILYGIVYALTAKTYYKIVQYEI